MALSATKNDGIATLAAKQSDVFQTWFDVAKTVAPASVAYGVVKVLPVITPVCGLAIICNSCIHKLVDWIVDGVFICADTVGVIIIFSPLWVLYAHFIAPKKLNR
jgi:hypothetical protein